MRSLFLLEKKYSKTICLFVFFIMYFSLNSSSQDSSLTKTQQALKAANAKLAIFTGFLDRQEPGPYVSKDSTPYIGTELFHTECIAECTSLFSTVMNKHNIGSRKRARLFPKFQLETISEDFGGVQFSDWVCKMITTHDSAGNGANLTFTIQFAIYTQNFLDNNLPCYYQKDPKRNQIIADRLGRITAILVVNRKKASNSVVRLTDEPPLGGFDLGEIHP